MIIKILSFFFLVFTLNELNYFHKLLTLIKTLIKIYSLFNSDFFYLYDVLDVIDCIDPKNIPDTFFAERPDPKKVGEYIAQSNYHTLSETSRETIHEWAKDMDLQVLQNNIVRLDLDNKTWSQSTEVPAEEKSKVCSTIGKIKEVILNQIDDIKRNR